MATLLELFGEDDFSLLFESLESRKRYYQRKLPQQEIDAAYGSAKQKATLEKYNQKIERIDCILSIISEEAS